VAHGGLALALLLQGRAEEALAHHEAMQGRLPREVQVQVQGALWLFEAAALLQQKRFEQVLEVCARGMVEEPSADVQASGWCMRGQALMALKRSAEALDAYEAALALDLLLRPAWAGRMRALVRLHRYRAAWQSVRTQVETLGGPLSRRGSSSTPSGQTTGSAGPPSRT
jgi:tetratricopeptide (TPR) repeat protein